MAMKRPRCGVAFSNVLHLREEGKQESVEHFVATRVSGFLGQQIREAEQQLSKLRRVASGPSTDILLLPSPMWHAGRLVRRTQQRAAEPSGILVIPRRILAARGQERKVVLATSTAESLWTPSIQNRSDSKRSRAAAERKSAWDELLSEEAQPGSREGPVVSSYPSFNEEFQYWWQRRRFTESDRLARLHREFIDAQDVAQDAYDPTLDRGGRGEKNAKFLRLTAAADRAEKALDAELTRLWAMRH